MEVEDVAPMDASAYRCDPVFIDEVFRLAKDCNLRLIKRLSGDFRAFVEIVFEGRIINVQTGLHNHVAVAVKRHRRL